MFKDWKTDLAALFIIVIIAASALKWITDVLAISLIGAATAAGLFSAQDSKKQP